MAAGFRGDILTFYLGGARFGIRLEAIREIMGVPATGLTPVPLAPDTLLGLMNLRGRAAAVVDTGAVLGMPGGAGYGILLLCERGGEMIGLAVDRLGEVIPGGKADLRRPERARDGLAEGELSYGGDTLPLIDLAACVEAGLRGNAP